MSNLSVGITFGCFIPMHCGHTDMITKARRENDVTVIAVAGFPGDRGEGFLSYDERILLTQRSYNDQPDCIVTSVNDKTIGLTGTFSEQAWTIWSQELFQNAQLDPNDPDIRYSWYTGEENYIEKLIQIHPNHRFILLDRQDIPVSGTQIRNDPNTFYRYIHPVFREYLIQKGRITDTNR